MADPNELFTQEDEYEIDPEEPCDCGGDPFCMYCRIQVEAAKMQAEAERQGA